MAINGWNWEMNSSYKFCLLTVIGTNYFSLVRQIKENLFQIKWTNHLFAVVMNPFLCGYWHEKGSCELCNWWTNHKPKYRILLHNQSCSHQYIDRKFRSPMAHIQTHVQSFDIKFRSALMGLSQHHHWQVNAKKKTELHDWRL